MLQPGQHVLITAATSSTGYSGIQLAKMMGATVIATTRTQAKRQNLIDAGVDHVIVTSDEDLVSWVKDITNGQGVELTYDPVAGPLLMTLAEAAARSGTIILYGALSSEPTLFPLMAAGQKALKFPFHTAFEFTGDAALGLPRNEEAVQRGIKFIYDGLASGQLKSVIDERIFQLDEIVEAHRYMESNKQNGKIVVKV